MVGNPHNDSFRRGMTVVGVHAVLGLMSILFIFNSDSDSDMYGLPGTIGVWAPAFLAVSVVGMLLGIGIWLRGRKH